MNPYNKRTYLVITILILLTLCVLPWAKLWPASQSSANIAGILGSSTESLSMNGPWIFELVRMISSLTTIGSMGMTSILILILTFLWIVPFLFTLIILILTLMNDEVRAYSLGAVTFRILYYYSMIYFGFILASQLTIDSFLVMTTSETELLSLARPGVGMYVMFFLSIFLRMLATPIYSCRQIYSIILSALLCFALLCPWIVISFNIPVSEGSVSSISISFSLMQVVLYLLIVMIMFFIMITILPSTGSMDSLTSWASSSGEMGQIFQQLISGAVFYCTIALLLAFFVFWTILTFDKLVRKKGQRQAVFLRTDSIMSLILSVIALLLIWLISYIVITSISTVFGVTMGQTASQMLSIYPGFGLILTLIVSLTELCLLRFFGIRLLRNRSIPSLFVRILDPNALVNVADLFGRKEGARPVGFGQPSVFANINPSGPYPPGIR